MLSEYELFTFTEILKIAGKRGLFQRIRQEIQHNFGMEKSEMQYIRGGFSKSMLTDTADRRFYEGSSCLKMKEQ